MMKKNVIAYAVLITLVVILLVFVQSKSQTIDKLNDQNLALQEKITDAQAQLDDIKNQLSQATEIQQKQQQELKSMNNVMEHNEELREEVKSLKDKLAKCLSSKTAAAKTAKPVATSTNKAKK